MSLEVKKFNTIDATPAIVSQDYTFLKKSHKTLLLLRRQSKESKLELRHQRTGDVVFDWDEPGKPHKKPDFYIYKLIEILLPRAMCSSNPKKKVGKSSKLSEKDVPELRMVELWAQDPSPRKGWIKVQGMNY